MIRTVSARLAGLRVYAALALLLVAAPAWALQVSNSNDSGSGSLRAAVAAGGAVTFAAAMDNQTITLSSAPISIPAGTSINGPGADRLTISGGNARRLFEIAAGVNGVSISGLRLSNGSAAGNGQGGAIHNLGGLTLNGVAVIGNRAADAGGGVYNRGQLQVYASSFSGNTVNGATCAGGGAIRSEGAGSQLRIESSTISGNSAASCNGGGISFSGGSAAIISSTLFGNSAGSSGGNLYKGSVASVLTLSASVISDGSAGGGLPLNADLHGARIGGLTSTGFNLVRARGDGLGFVASDLADGTNPQLGVLASNSGTTASHALASTSPLRDAQASPCASSTDQRGIARPQGAGCDVGAYELRQNRLTVNVAAGGTVSAAATPAPLGSAISGCSGSCTADYEAETPALVTLIASPQPGHVLLGWSGDCSGTASSTTVSMGQARSCSAAFASTDVVVTPIAGPNGALSPATPQTIAYGSSTAFSVLADANHHILSVTGCGGSLSGTTFSTGAVTADCSVSASFAIDTFTVSGLAIGGGSVSPALQTVNYGQSATLTLTPDANHHLVSASGCGGSVSGNTFTTAMVTADCAVTATFAIDRHTVTASASGNGTITPLSQTVDHGQIATLILAPAANHHIVSVTGCGGSLSGNTFTTAAVVTDCVVTATFAIDRFTVTSSAIGNGTITPLSQDIDYDGIASLTVVPAANHHIVSVTGCGGSLSGSTFTTAAVTADCAVTATFAIDRHTVTASASGNGSITPLSQDVDHGALATLTVIPAANHHLVSVVGCGGSLSGDTFTTAAITADCAVTATFAIDRFTVTASATGNGTITPLSQDVDYNGIASLTVVPAANHHIVSVSGCGGSLVGDTFTTAAVTADCAVAATFAIDRHTVTASASGNGSITPLSQDVDHGALATLTVIPAANHHIVSVVGCGGSLSGDTFTTAAITADCAVTATFAIDRFTITASATGNGTITPLSQDVDYNGIATLTVTPAANHHIVSVTGCGGSLAGDTFTTAAITADCSVAATFAIDRHTVTASASGNGSITPLSQDVDHGALATLTVIPAANHHIVSVTGCGGSLSGDTFTTAAITADCDVTATFAIDRFTVTASATGNGTITPLSQQVDWNAIASLTVTPAANHHVVSVSGCGGSLSGSTFTTAAVTADCAVQATFAVDTHTIGGSVAGLLGSGLTLQLNGGQDLVIAANGVFQFPGVVDALTSYSVTVVQQPTAPRQLCTVANGSGTVGGLDIGNVLVSCDLPQALLSVQVDDDRSYVRYGMLVNYVVTVSNSGDGDADNVLVSDLVSTAMDAPFIRWYCFGAGAGADCVASGTGPLYDATVRVPAGRSLSWLVTAPVRLLAPEGTLNYQVTAQGSNVSSDSDEDTLVILRTGADQPYGDGAEGAREADGVATDVPAAALCRFDLARTHALTVPATPATSAVETLARMRGANAAGFRIERHALAATPQVRVVTIDPQGVERAGEWARATGATLSLGSVMAEDGTRVLLIEGTEPLLSEPLPAGTQTVLQWQLPAHGSTAPVCPTDSAE